MLEKFYPSECKDSVYDIDFNKMYEKGYRSVIFDVDNTLVPHGAPADDKAIAFFKKLHEIGYKTLLLSNNKEYRVKSFAEAVDALYIYKANKPSKAGYLAAMERMGTNRNNTIFVGDQIFTDIWGANNAAIHSILTKPINPKEEIQIILKRIPEKWVMYFYNRRNKR